MLHHHFQKIERHIMQRQRIRIKDFFLMIDEDAFLVILAILSILNIILAPLPVNSLVLGIPMMVLSAFYIIDVDISRHHHRRWMRHPIRCHSWRALMPKSRPIFKWLDRYIKPRYRNFVTPNLRIIAGLSLFFLSIIIFLPIPFANTPGSVGMLALSLGILQKDGLCALAGYIITLLHAAGVVAFVATMTQL